MMCSATVTNMHVNEIATCVTVIFLKIDQWKCCVSFYVWYMLCLACFLIFLLKLFLYSFSSFAEQTWTSGSVKMTDFSQISVRMISFGVIETLSYRHFHHGSPYHQSVIANLRSYSHDQASPSHLFLNLMI